MEEEKNWKEILKKFEEDGINDIEVVEVEIPTGTPLREGETREYIRVKSDYMLPTAGALYDTPGVKFEMVREDIGLVTEVIITDVKVLANLRMILDHVISEGDSGSGMYL